MIFLSLLTFLLPVFAIDDCKLQNGCENCTSNGWNCVWCEDLNQCVAGGPFGPTNVSLSCGLLSWNYKNCQRMK